MGPLAQRRQGQRGPVEDGGYFYTYVRYVRPLAMTAVIHHSGVHAAMIGDPVTLEQLTFVRGTDAQGRGRCLPLGEVPPALLSECWNDWLELAAVAQPEATP